MDRSSEGRVFGGMAAVCETGCDDTGNEVVDELALWGDGDFVRSEGGMGLVGVLDGEEGRIGR